jgi:hypothetical protein
VLVPAPGMGPGFWAGASSAAFDADGSLVVAYRVRTPDARGASLVVGRTGAGGEIRPLATLEKERFGAESLERPALVAVDGGWRLYVSCATPGSKHWRIDLLESTDPSGLATAPPRTVFSGSGTIGVKDPVVRRTAAGWRAWICCHPLDVEGEEDRMSTALATSADGVSWDWHGTVLAGRPGEWDARGARVTAILPDGRVTYDGRATKEENFRERTGLAHAARGDRLAASGPAPVAGVRYLDFIAGPDSAFALFYERPRADGGHELCCERVQSSGLG